MILFLLYSFLPLLGAFSFVFPNLPILRSKRLSLSLNYKLLTQPLFITFYYFVYTTAVPSSL